jgi:hypothetical protein
VQKKATQACEGKIWLYKRQVVKNKCYVRDAMNRVSTGFTLDKTDIIAEMNGFFCVMITKGRGMGKGFA